MNQTAINKFKAILIREQNYASFELDRYEGTDVTYGDTEHTASGVNYGKLQVIELLLEELEEMGVDND